jgi:hypothetical protein
MEVAVWTATPEQEAQRGRVRARRGPARDDINRSRRVPKHFRSSPHRAETTRSPIRVSHTPPRPARVTPQRVRPSHPRSARHRQGAVGSLAIPSTGARCRIREGPQARRPDGPSTCEGGHPHWTVRNRSVATLHVFVGETRIASKVIPGDAQVTGGDLWTKTWGGWWCTGSA